MNSSSPFLVAVIAVITLLISGCASPPLLEIQQAREAVAMARDFEADIYAPDQYDLALMNMEMAEVEIEDQLQISALNRNYDRALTFIDTAIIEAEQAQFQAEDYKAQIFQQAESTIPIAQTAVDDAFDVLRRARPFLAFQEAQSLEATMNNAATSLGLARQLMDEGGFADAAARLDEIVISARAIQTRAEFVIETAPQ
jgi:hypothetical protein